ncbi:McrB family protein [Lacihabitans lacunae]|uniref:McrB family protein n=1 Tax=Lacihabitans lacunae TaxID=1028214 RepID=A0ABV7YS29_9BACT
MSSVKSKYAQLEEFIFRKLWEDYKVSGKTFSVRKSFGDKNQDRFFIGTEKSNYLGFSYWSISLKIRNPIDVTSFVLGEAKGGEFYYNFQFVCPGVPKDDLEKACLFLALDFESHVKTKFENKYGYKNSKKGSKDYMFSIYPHKTFSDLESLWVSFTEFSQDITSVLENSIIETRGIYNDLETKRIEKGEFEKQIANLEKNNQIFLNKIKKEESNTNMPSKNTILYGPPGTGKTYHTVEMAFQIVNDNKKVDYKTSKDWFSKELQKEEDRQVDFITFHQNYSYEDFVMGIKPSLNGEEMSFRNHKGVFFEICQRAKLNLEQSSEKGGELVPDFQTVFDELLMPLTIDGNEIPIKMLKEGYEFSISGLNEKNLNFKKQKGDSQHTLSIQTIKDLFEGNREFNIQGLGSYYYPLVEELKNIQVKLTRKVSKVDLKNYVLIIDEINRANISRVFGELITLIEENKRWGETYQMEVRLPDGKTRFTVPKNLYIIGTMNTADKSIALLDIALRRRFDFVGLYPNSDLVVENWKTFFITLNENIISQKGKDFAIGHSYFMLEENKSFDFVNVMNKKVLPLLNEYFYSSRNSDLVKNLINSALIKSKLPYELLSDGYSDKIVSSK